ncbi:MAG: hypothetical protein ACTHN5_06380 [Phycisphaerae bacterium]
MTKRVYGWVVLGILGVGLAGTFAGCSDMGYANDVADLQSQQRMNRGIPGPTELPPGLGDDLPPAPEAQPVATNK